MEEIRKHSIAMDNREKLTITAVDDVVSFDEEKVIVDTEMGTMTVFGSDFRIHKLNVDDGQLVIEGRVDEIQYSETHKKDQKGFFARMFQ